MVGNNRVGHDGPTGPPASFEDFCVHCSKKKQQDRDADARICLCCDKLRSVLLVPVGTSESNLGALLAELGGQIRSGNSPNGKDFVQTKEQFLEDNYPHFDQGMHTHPDIFIAKQKQHGFPEPGEETSQERGNISEGKVYECLTQEFKDDDCFIFHSYKSGIDNKVVTKFCAKLLDNLSSGTYSVAEVENKMKIIADLAFLDWNAIEEEAKTKSSPGSDKVVICRAKLSAFKTSLNSKSQEKDFFVVSLTLTAIIHFEVKSSSPSNAKAQIFMMRKYLEQLQVPDMTGEWSLIGFVAIPEVFVEDADPRGNKFQNCNQCKKHHLWKDDFLQGGFYDRVRDLIKHEQAVTNPSFSDVHPSMCKRKTSLKNALKIEEEEKAAIKVLETARKKRNYIQLISNIVVLSNMDLLPHSHAVGKVINQLTGSNTRVAGPGDAMVEKSGLCSCETLMLWNRNQKNFKCHTPDKAIVCSDFGCGKSVYLHSLLLSISQSDPMSCNFLLSFLVSSEKPPFPRGVLDISNRMRYESEQVEVIDVRDIMSPENKTRSRLNLPQASGSKDDIFAFLYDLTAAYPQSNIAVDEVPLELLIQKQKIHHNAFRGCLWLAPSSVSVYDFRNQKETTNLSLISVEKNQGFTIIHLNKNMRNGRHILKDSFKLQESTIEKGVTNPSSLDIPKDQPDSSNIATVAARGATKKEHSIPTFKTPLWWPKSLQRRPMKETLPLPTQNSQETDLFKKKTSCQDQQVAQQSKGTEARVITGVKDAIYKGPSEEAVGCPTIAGMKPRVIKDVGAEQFMKEIIPKRCLEKKEVIVILGNDEDDIDWILDCLSEDEEFTKTSLTVYHPLDESEIKDAETSLQTYLNDPQGCLVTLGRLFNGMESATVVLVFNNPYASHFRANYMRASVELILVDRHMLGTANILMSAPQQPNTLTDPDSEWKQEKKRLELASLLERRRNYSWDNFVSLADIPSWADVNRPKETKTTLTKDLLINFHLNEDPKISNLSKKISIFVGDITKLEVDAVVSSTNTFLSAEHDESLSGSIHRMAGPLFEAENKVMGGCKEGQAVISCGYQLPARYVISTVGPSGNQEPKELLESCYKSCLELMLANKLRSIAFPCISTGMKGVPKKAACIVALETVRRFLEEHHGLVDWVVFCLFTKEDTHIYKELLPAFFSSSV